LQAYLRRKENGRYYWHWDPAFIEGVTRSRTSDGKLSGQGRDAFSAAAASLRLPVHLIRGGSSDLVSPDAAAHFLELAPHAEFSDIAGATHMVAGDQNDAFGQAILRFLGDAREAEKTS
jgi:pimeloyl-ACP methyl ester carboxylesterase